MLSSSQKSRRVICVGHTRPKNSKGRRRQLEINLKSGALFAVLAVRLHLKDSSAGDDFGPISTLYWPFRSHQTATIRSPKTYPDSCISLQVRIIICVGEAYLFDRNGHWLSLFREFFGASTTAGLCSAASHHCTTRYRLSLIPPHNICHNRLHTVIANDS